MPLTNTGYDAPDITELVEEMSETARSLFGPLIDTSANSALGHFIGVTSIEMVKIYEDLQELYSNMNANTAEGRMLENLALLGGLVRKNKTFSTGIVDFTGPVGTEIPKGFKLHVAGDSNRVFLVREATTISPSGEARAQVIAEDTGATAAPAGTLTELVSAVAGLTVTNPTAITIGTDEIESDELLRSRRNNTLSVGGNGTAIAIRASLEQIAGVTIARVITNPTHYYQPRGDGIYQRPPHSIECVVEGGDENEIIETIALTKSAGTDSFGLLMAFYQDYIGNQHQIRFSRPDIVDIDVAISYRVYDEEIFPADGEARLAAAITDFASVEYVLGKDVLRDRLNTPCFTVAGVANLEITVSSNEVASNAITGDIPIEEFQKARILAENITLTKLTAV
jgi:uncharacterized phage protein gp47/JayE